MKSVLSNKKFWLLMLTLVFMCLMLSGCIPGTRDTDAPAGFFWGIWHGWIAPVSLVVSIFNKSANIYEINNIGFWYDFGFYMAVVSGFGGLAISRKKSKRIKISDE
ncbi:MAG: hypothetical protein FWE82_00795 [Defluviitaleaceae bacterium]|nr:hypothetical protein [Defluviitaleaceae bacterium]